MKYLEVYFNGVLKHSLPIQSDVISIGRSADNDVVIDNMGVSGHHAIISKKDRVYYVEDLNSTNGTFLNSQKISSQQKLNQPDSLSIGKHSLKISDWSQSKNNTPSSTVHDSSDSTVMVSRGTAVENSQQSTREPQEKQFYLLVRGESTGIKKLLLSDDSYGIGKARDNEIRVGGWFTSAYIAEIEKIGHSFYISPLAKGKIKVNNHVIKTSTQLGVSDEIRIKSLYLKFLTN